MSTNPLAKLGALLCGAFFTTHAVAALDTTNLLEPIGTLSASPTVVLTGTKPSLKWEIAYPSFVKEVVNLESNATLRPKEELELSVRIIGTGVTHKSPYTGLIVYDPVDLYIKVGTQAYVPFCFKSNPEINPAEVVYTARIPANTPINFKGRYYIKETNQWFPFYDSSTSTINVRALFNGDVPPSKLPAHNAPSLEKFLAPYLNSSGQVAIGPMDSIVFMELTHTPSQTGNRGYDMQDCVMLITFKKVMAK